MMSPIPLYLEKTTGLFAVRRITGRTRDRINQNAVMCLADRHKALLIILKGFNRRNREGNLSYDFRIKRKQLSE